MALVTTKNMLTNGVKKLVEYSKKVGVWLKQYIFSEIGSWLYELIQSFYNPIKRHQFLYGKRWGWIVFSAFITTGVVALIVLFSHVLGITTVDLIGEYSKPTSLFWGIISQFADPGNIHMANEKGLWIALLCALAGIVCLSGLVVSSFVNAISIKSEKWKKGLIHYGWWTNKVILRRNYIVIIGVNEQTATIIKTALQSKVRYVLIQSSKNIEDVRQKLNLALDKHEEKSVIFYHGERTSSEDIAALRLQDAKEVYILGEDMSTPNEQDHDAFNMTCLEHIAHYMEDYREHRQHHHYRSADKNTDKNVHKRLKCHVNFEYQSTFMAFKFTHIYQSMNGMIEFLPFNVHEIWAKKLLVDNYAIIPSTKQTAKRVVRYEPLDAYWAEGTPDQPHPICYINENSDIVVHLVVMGMNQMGVALAMQAALLNHLPNFHRDNRLRTTITFIDNNAVKEGEYLMGRYSALFDLCRHRTITTAQCTFDKNNYLSPETNNPYDIQWQNKKSGSWCDYTDPMQDGRFQYMGSNFMDLQWEFIEGNVASKPIQDYLSVLALDTAHRTTTIAVCFNNPQQSIATALYLPSLVLRRALQILVYQQNSFDMINKVATSERDWKRYAKLKPFGMIEGCYTGSIFDNTFAMLANMVYQDSSLNEKSKEPYTSTFIMKARRIWDELGIVDKMANIDLADSFALKLRSKESSMDSRSKAEHLRWLTERLTMGYRPLEEQEHEQYKSTTDYKYSKEYYKLKYRAHIDIADEAHVKQWDKPVYDKQTDTKLIRLIPAIQRWSYHIIIQDILSNPQYPYFTLVKQMKNISNFSIQQCPVTLELWKQVMGILPLNLPNGNANSPITNISYDDVQDFLMVLNSLTKLPFNLPSKKQWTTARNEKTLNNMVGSVWQWTKSKGDEYASSRIFCGRSRLFEENKSTLEYSYWLPTFKSTDLGFRLLLPINIPETADDNSNDDLLALDNEVINNMLQRLVYIEGNGKDIPSSFYVSPTPVTQVQWKAVMGYGNFNTDVRKNISEHRGDNFPVENVSYDDAHDFLGALSELRHAQFRLPSQTQWLYVAQKTDAVHKRIWHSGIAKSTHAVPHIPEENKEVYDLLGNVWEWCEGIPPEGVPAEICHILQGGSWRFTEKECIDTLTQGGSYWLSDYRADDVGFRFVISEEEYKKLGIQKDNGSN